jgi:hypothetical protein
MRESTCIQQEVDSAGIASWLDLDEMVRNDDRVGARGAQDGRSSFMQLQADRVSERAGDRSFDERVRERWWVSSEDRRSFELRNRG